MPAAAKPAAQKPAVTPRPAVTRMPPALRNAAPQAQKSAADLLISRTATLDDPLTTSLLAEVTRRSKTSEVAPEQVNDAMDKAMDEALDIEPGDADPDDSI